jgi:hypothetical protein
MMLPTHALAGMALSLPVALAAPEFAPPAIIGGLVGGVLPDLDLYAGHRRTLHFPTLYPIAAALAIVAAVVLATPAAVAAAFVLLGAALHCRMDVYGGGLELRPWEGNSDRAVYDHVAGEWIKPRRAVAYDGSRGDLALSTAFGLPLLVALRFPYTAVVAAALTVAAVYVLLRRRLAALAPVVFGYVPEPLARYVPDRYREGTADPRR